jgi:hypothetical protein
MSSISRSTAHRGAVAPLAAAAPVVVHDGEVLRQQRRQLRHRPEGAVGKCAVDQNQGRSAADARDAEAGAVFRGDRQVRGRGRRGRRYRVPIPAITAVS